MKRKHLLIALCLLLALTPLAALAETMYVDTSNGGGVNLRSGPSTDYDVLAYIGYGESVEVLEMLAGSAWVNVNYNGYYGYIMMRYLSYNPPMPGPIPTYVPAPTAKPTLRPTAKPTKAPKNNSSSLEKTLKQLFDGFGSTSYQAVVTPSTPTTYVNLRWAPSESAPVRDQYWSGSLLQVLSENGAWSEVYDSSTGMHGFIMSKFLKRVSYGDGSGS